MPVLLLAVAVAAALPGASRASRGQQGGAAQSDLTTAEGEYEEFRRSHGRSRRGDGGAEYAARRVIFEARRAAVEAHNANPSSSWKAAVNKFADYTDREVRGMMGYKRVGRRPRAPGAAAPSSFLQAEPGRALAESFDWRERLNHSSQFLRDQGSCGSCWAVSSVGALEMHAEIETRSQPTQLSFEQLVDCVPNPRHCGGTGGCSGATAELAFEYVQEHGLAVADSYKGYTSGGDGKCKEDNQASTRVTAQGFERLPENKLKPLLEAVANKGPIVVSVDAGGWASYASGVYDSCEKDAVVNHAVLLVGYGADAGVGKKYWLIRNSWGGGWGEAGHIRVMRHESDEGDAGYCGVDHSPQKGVGCDNGPTEIPVCGMCGILSDSAYPLGVRIESPSSV